MPTRPLDLPVCISTPIVDNTSAQTYDMIYVSTPLETLVNSRAFASAALLGFASAQNYDIIHVSKLVRLACKLYNLYKARPLLALPGRG